VHSTYINIQLLRDANVSNGEENRLTSYRKGTYRPDAEIATDTA